MPNNSSGWRANEDGGQMMPRAARTYWFAAGLLALLLAQPALAWNYVTHRVIAAMAYDHLTPAARAHVDALIRMHPDYMTMFLKDAPASEPARSRSAFILAAIWADQLRGDSRFYEDAPLAGSPATPQPTPTLPGFPDMKRHAGWHFIDQPFSQDGTALEPAPGPNIVTELERLLLEVAHPASESQEVYDLPWLIHLVGDIHAPLHCVARFSIPYPEGDQGGNLAFVAPGTGPTVTLHKFWDDAVGTATSAGFVDRTAREVSQAWEDPAAQRPQEVLMPELWAQESLNVSKKYIYTFGPENGSHDRPVVLATGYAENARKVAQDQALKAAVRLAAVLNRSLK